MNVTELVKTLLPHDTDEFQKQALAAEQMGEWPKPWLNYAVENGLFHLAVPEIYGGRQLDLLELMTVFEQAAKLDGSFGWSLTLAAGAGPFTAYMNPDFVNSHFSSPRACIAGTGFPGGTFEPTNGGIITSGQWKYITGAPHATLFTAVCKAAGGDETKAVAFLPDEVTLDKSWTSYGLKATASHNMAVKNVTVPPERIFTLNNETLRVDEPLFRFPFEPFAKATLASTFWGIGRHFMEEAKQLLAAKDDRSEQAVQLIKNADEVLQNARRDLRNSSKLAWQLCLKGEQPTEETLNKISAATRNLVQKTLDEVQKVYRLCGMAVLNEESVINRAWRDLHTAGQHVFLR